MNTEKRRKLRILQKAIRKAKDEVIKGNAQEWLRGFKRRPWYGAAVRGYVEITNRLGALLQDWQDDTLKIIQRDMLFTIEKEKKYRTEEYLDSRYNRVVVDDVRDELVELQRSYRAKLETLFSSVIAGKLATGIAGALKTEHMPFNFNKYNELVRNTIRDKKIHWAKQVAEATEQQIKAVLVDGYEKGLSSFDISTNIKNRTTFSIARAEKVARTETMAAASMSDYARFAVNDDVIGYRWRSANNSRTRESHKTANKQFRAKDVPFMVGGHKMLHPGDNTYGAPAREIVNCRCWLEPVFADEESALTEAERKALSAPRYIETIDMSNPNLIESKLREFEEYATDKTVEHAMAILQNGKCYRFVGQAAEVNPLTLGVALQGAIISHNHPKNETEYSLSNQDLQLLIESGAAEVRGFDYKYEYFMKMEGKYSLEELEQAYAKAYSKARETVSMGRYEEDFRHTINSYLTEVIKSQYIRRVK